MEEMPNSPKSGAAADAAAEEKAAWSSGVDTRAVTAPFPRRMYELLEQEDASVISWTGDGKAFRIHNPTLFSNTVLPKYFRHSKLTSLQRQLNLYGFTHVTKGPIAGSYLHPLFQRGHPETLDMIKRASRKGQPQGGIGMGYGMGWNMGMPPMPGSLPPPGLMYGMPPMPGFMPPQGSSSSGPGAGAPPGTGAAGAGSTPPSGGPAGGFPPPGYPGYGYIPPPMPTSEMMSAWQQPFSYPRPLQSEERPAKRARPTPETLEKLFKAKEEMDTQAFNPLAEKLSASLGPVAALALALAIITERPDAEASEETKVEGETKEDSSVADTNAVAEGGNVEVTEAST